MSRFVIPREVKKNNGSLSISFFFSLSAGCICTGAFHSRYKWKFPTRLKIIIITPNCLNGINDKIL